jgi:hypothetical protein
LPRYFSMVRALAGDSTMTRLVLIVSLGVHGLQRLGRRRGVQRIQPYSFEFAHGRQNSNDGATFDAAAQPRRGQLTQAGSSAKTRSSMRA